MGPKMPVGSPHDSHDGASSSSASNHYSKPQYMTVGNGSASESAARLQAILDADSGYGGSIMSDDVSENGWHPGPLHDQYVPPHVPVAPGETNAASEHERKALASHVHQLFYNQNRTTLGRAINETVESTLR